jgi:hypothetical protein
MAFTQSPLGESHRSVIEPSEHMALGAHCQRPRAKKAGSCEVSAPGSTEELEHRMRVVEKAESGGASGMVLRGSEASGQQILEAALPRAPLTEHHQKTTATLHELAQALGRSSLREAYIVQHDHRGSLKVGLRNRCGSPDLYLKRGLLADLEGSLDVETGIGTRIAALQNERA